MRMTTLAVGLALSWFAVSASATIFGGIRGLVHDPHHRPISGAEVTVRSRTSEWRRVVETNQAGEFLVPAVPLGEYLVTVAANGFEGQEKSVVVISGPPADLHFQMALATVQQRVEVSAEAEAVNPSSSTTQTLVSREEVATAPGADRSNSLAIITDFVPGAYLVHDQLHVRGGHQVTWMVDGVPVPNTSIASNVGPQLDPKDIDYLEVQRGGYSAEYGDRTYAMLNVVPRSGFERNHSGELVLGYGSYNSSDDQISFGSHTNRFAYYASVNGNRTDLGLETPTSKVLHDMGSGLGAFTSLIFNRTPADQLRLVASARGDFYQVPNDRDAQASGVRDREREQDAFANFSWVHSSGAGLVLTVSPFYHFNRAAFEGGPQDVPIAVDNRASHYGGGQMDVALARGKHNVRAGFYAFAQHDDTLFALAANDGSGSAFRERDQVAGDLEALFVEEQYKAFSWLTLNAGSRFTRFSATLTETAWSPRLGAAIRLPGLNWVLRGAYGRYYQAPPLSTLSGPLLQLASTQGFGFLPLRGERDEQHEIGLAIPWRGWVADLVSFRTGAHNFFDHDVLGNSNIFFPLTLEHVRIRGYEATLRSPRLFRRAEAHLAYSHQSAEAQGARTGGLTDFSPPEQGFIFLDHDQRDSLSAGFRSNLPRRSWLAGNFTYGSGFLNGNGPAHLPSYRTFDLSLGKAFGESWSAKISALNLTNKRYQLDLSNTFGGSHFAYPRMISLQVRYRFHY